MYAVISDIHGNLPALTAVLNDAETMGAQKYLLLGDYTNSFPFQNEIAGIISCLPNLTAIRGNHENYLIDINTTPPDEHRKEMLGPLYWSYECHSRESYDIITKLPESTKVNAGDCIISLTHHVRKYIPLYYLYLDSTGYAELMRQKPFIYEEFIYEAKNWLLNNDVIKDALLALPKGVYLFGHSHVAVHVEYEGRYMINPGSCGFSADFDNRAAYALLKKVSSNENGFSWEIIQKRVKYDINTVTNAMKQSGFTGMFPEWYDVFNKQLNKADDTLVRFVHR